MDYLLLVIGLVVLVVGGDLLVRGAVGIAERLAISPLIIGLTIVSFGTSAPELFISVDAALIGSGGMAIGNVVGSNIANVLLVLGLPAIIHVTCCEENGIGRNIVVMIGFTLVFMAMLASGEIGRLFGGILLVLLALFLWDQYRSATNGDAKEAPDYHDEIGDFSDSPQKSAIFAVGGILLLPIGAWLTVNNASSIAETWGVSDEVIGLTVVAIGTSLPELAASIMAVIRKNTSVAIGNVVGSNIFNIAAIMGITAVISPLTVGPNIISSDMWVMLGAAAILAAIAMIFKSIGRIAGLAMTLAYSVYVLAALLF